MHLMLLYEIHQINKPCNSTTHNRNNKQMKQHKRLKLRAIHTALAGASAAGATLPLNFTP